MNRDGITIWLSIINKTKESYDILFICAGLIVSKGKGVSTQRVSRTNRWKWAVVFYGGEIRISVTTRACTKFFCETCVKNVSCVARMTVNEPKYHIKSYDLYNVTIFKPKCIRLEVEQNSSTVKTKDFSRSPTQKLVGKEPWNCHSQTFLLFVWESKLFRHPFLSKNSPQQNSQKEEEWDATLQGFELWNLAFMLLFLCHFTIVWSTGTKTWHIRIDNQVVALLVQWNECGYRWNSS